MALFFFLYEPSFHSSWAHTFVESEKTFILDGLAEAVHGSTEPTVGSFNLQASLDGIHGLSDCHLGLLTILRLE